MKRVFHIVIAGCLSALLIFGSTAKEFVHLFAQHEDTIHNPHHVCPEGEAHFEHEHHHCDFLHFVLEPFANDAFLPKINLFNKSLFVQVKCNSTSVFTPLFVDHISLRGPPRA